MQIQCIGKRINSDYMGWRGTVSHIYRLAGITGFTRGFLATLGWVGKTSRLLIYDLPISWSAFQLFKVRDIPAFGIYFYTYELLVGQVNLLKIKSSGMIFQKPFQLKYFDKRRCCMLEANATFENLSRGSSEFSQWFIEDSGKITITILQISLSVFESAVINLFSSLVVSLEWCHGF